MWKENNRQKQLNKYTLFSFFLSGLPNPDMEKPEPDQTNMYKADGGIWLILFWI